MHVTFAVANILLSLKLHEPALRPLRCMVAANVHAFVLLGTSSIRRPRRRQPNVVTKDKNLFYC